ncbi:oxidoreductase [Reticulibacter mediterranei]|uniref:Oxidoreductase n=1 Tax=Reticulibacter mediterranei TaxID=2778369 RepID=A0A8J3IC84_9CHLR|nr:Gfo/Idh/MocA family oxidoreductase [Reticulibacter mediterranei]GHO90903.1 oxidoreductase [Reticulibacter mediterranei]
MQHNKQIRAVMVGCGGMSRAWLDAASQTPDLEIVGLVDVIEEAARKRAAEYNLESAAIDTDLASVLESTSPDAVFNCTIPEAHTSVTLTAFDHGCHVLGEKPLADSMEDARMLIEAARKAGKLFAVIQNRRFEPGVRRARAFLQSGAIGPVTTINSDFYIGAHFGGFRDHMEHVLLLDMAIHTFDAARFLSGADPVAVYCKEWNPAGSWYDHGASAVATFEMSNGLIYTYRGSWCAEGFPTTWESDWRFIGQNGSLKWTNGADVQAQVVAATGGFQSTYQDVAVPLYDGVDDVAGHKSLIQEFVTCIQTGTEPETICTDNIKSLAMVFGAIESAETGKRVAISW